MPSPAPWARDFLVVAFVVVVVLLDVIFVVVVIDTNEDEDEHFGFLIADENFFAFLLAGVLSSLRFSNHESVLLTLLSSSSSTG